MTKNVLFVCLGNICRSPTAEGILTTLVERDGLSDQIGVDSAGTGDWQIGKPPHPKAVSFAAAHGYDLSELRARQITCEDFEQFDYILAMDRQNLSDLSQIKPESYQGHLGLLLEFDKSIPVDEVPDPFGMEDTAFRNAFTLIERSVRNLFEDIRKHL